ncbi:hypothetical protein CW749_02410 [Vibrio sp. vnigr-6D03]|uniref:hypothetical protein n=1 Tax=Vibrio sp. vnigr-6D03 TaxID=2058088 RepID=UPI000C32B95D|nr:hypothetical protein [Vibrio sp. vnigr-6D03]PKF81508.1 hypothetical protein CW749_02410 [Vibrio sp. vnigr-6D03]
MNRRLKTTWITMLSIVALLFSGFVTSAPVMMMTMAEHQIESNVSPCHASSSPMADNLSAHKSHSPDRPIHSLMADSGKNDASDACSPASHEGHTCCAAVCGVTFVPLLTRSSMNVADFALAPIASITIGDALSRTQSLFRPPITESIF